MYHSDADYLRLACANLHFGGISPAGDLSPLFETLAVLSGWDVHIALLQEVSAGDEIGLKKHVRLIASELGMTLAALGAQAPMTYGPNRPAVFVCEPAGLKIVDYGPPEGVSGGVPRRLGTCQSGNPGCRRRAGPAQRPPAAKIRGGAGAAGRMDGQFHRPVGKARLGAR
jgi:hypothetical protein